MEIFFNDVELHCSCAICLIPMSVCPQPIPSQFCVKLDFCFLFFYFPFNRFSFRVLSWFSFLFFLQFPMNCPTVSSSSLISRYSHEALFHLKTKFSIQCDCASIWQRVENACATLPRNCVVHRSIGKICKYYFFFIYFYFFFFSFYHYIQHN